MFGQPILTINKPQSARFWWSKALWRGGAWRCNRTGRPEMTKFIKLIKNTKGATAIEYGLIAALIAVAAIAAMQSVGNKLNTTFNNVSNALG
jgi:pilus assembly protein Flp/PilA